MSKLIDCPAAGTNLDLACLPLFMRLVSEREGNWGAPEKHRVYRKILYGAEFFNGIVKLIATYRLHESQPSDAILRDAEQWQVWCRAEYDRMRDLQKLAE